MYGCCYCSGVCVWVLLLLYGKCVWLLLLLHPYTPEQQQPYSQNNEEEPYYILKTNNPYTSYVPDKYDPDHFMPWFNIGGNSAIVIRYRLDSQFHCSYLESRGVPEKTREIQGESSGNYLPFISISGSGDVISDDVISSDATSGEDPPHDPPQIRPGWCIYTTFNV